MGDQVDISQFPKILTNMGSTNEEVLMLSGLIPRLHYLLQFGTPKQAFESSWALTNIASGTTEHTNFIVENGIVHTFIVLLNSPDLELAEQCLWGIGNISGDSVQMRDFVLSLNVTDAIVQLSQKSCQPDTLIRNIAWTIGNLLRGKPHPDIKYAKPFLPVLHRLIKVEHLPITDELFRETLYSFYYAAEHSEIIKEIFFEFRNNGTLEKLFRFLDNRTTKLPSLRVLCSLLVGSTLVAAILDCNILDYLLVFLGDEREIIVKESLCALYNITSTYKNYVQRVIDSKVFQKVFNFCVLGSHKIRYEALYVVGNTLTKATPQQVEYLVSIDLAKFLGVLLDYVIQNEDIYIHKAYFLSLKAVFTKPEGDQLVQICDNFQTHGWNVHFKKLLNAKADDYCSDIIKETFYIYTEGHKPTISSDNIIVGLSNFQI
ncbi:hypothetical protein DLAC_11505 [Tieghemostelium lacteum]|uniref:Importin subunit alpha n=1 Tax=Tieghemostelium lacteum TaxID=361077 RepID=A0A152A568_TIELA|nr:hypothetical protein DLAC_11505 [Tieghemostelium lacteum]|eukprot:KYR01379.1 hypothetical protein DLAC_11505 [Tieghemostelium lacteum]